MTSDSSFHVVVVGGGVAGLTAALFAGRSGARVSLVEASSEVGGRARTRREGDFHFNMGPHALYRCGPAEEVLTELGLSLDGAPPDASRGLAIHRGALYQLPSGPLSLMTTRLLGAREKIGLGRVLARFPKLDPGPWQSRSLRTFLDETFPSPRPRAIFEALVRLSSYVHAPDALSAGMAIEQLQQALSSGVRYLDGGWQSMVDGLETKAREAGVVLHEGLPARALEMQPAPVVRLRDGRGLAADAVVLALGPREASALVEGGRDRLLSEEAERSLPVRAACLDVGLDRLPDPRRSFALGIDEPTYLSLYSAAARGLAPGEGAVLQIARYLAPDEKPDRAEIQAQLESRLDALQPGWRRELRTRTRWLDLRVAHALPTAERGGLAGRPRVDALESTRPGLYLAGDWVGPEGWLVDGAFASGRDAGRAAARWARSRLHG